ncbi:MAG: Sapep family Mn(2+)-dependent dipeptidase [Lactobacillales bacterium]|jgi:succinyl-diaminopimelate desuccinylase|nr:Sapep family Mn(2+)-dependent dipeptidase [Lactobacillales bacterium]
MERRIKEKIREEWNDYLKDLATVIEVPSVLGEAQADAPFGQASKQAIEVATQLAQGYGLDTDIVGNAVGYAQLGADAKDYYGVLGHLDVVPVTNQKWTSDPFLLTKRGDKLYARGILDNKGPIISCLFGLKILNELGVVPKTPIRVLFGSDEESGSHDIPLYLAQEKPPIFGFTPDGKYPVVYGERGIVNVEIRTSLSKDELAELGEITGDMARDHVSSYVKTSVNGAAIEVSGKSSPSNAPELGVNAITMLADQLAKLLPKNALQSYFEWLADSLDEKHYGEGLGIAFEDEESGKLIVTPVILEKEEEGMLLHLAIRYPVTVNEETVIHALEQHLPPHSTLEVVRRLKSTNQPKDTPFIRLLSEVYEEETGLDGTPVTTTGATYARFMPNIVAFGPSFPGQKGIAHKEDEWMNEADLLKNMEIYTLAMYRLASL